MASLQRLDLGAGSWMLFEPGFVSESESDVYLQRLRVGCRWAQLPGIFGHLQPRLIASYGDAGVSYRYSGRDYEAEAWPAVQGRRRSPGRSRINSGTSRNPQKTRALTAKVAPTP